MSQVDYETLFAYAPILTLSESNIAVLNRPFSKAKVEFALKGIFPAKSPVPVTYHALFIRNFGMLLAWICLLLC